MEITDDGEYGQALALLDELLDDYDNQIVLIELLSKSIGRWEDVSTDISVLKQRIADGDPAVSELPTLMEQHGLARTIHETADPIKQPCSQAPVPVTT